ncbi:hypothetical protein [Streptomyces sp. BPTC-684]|uniref:hypothetical protein n=1 Tax=Streptomyces sp. BPTC-684 TaxID=3043734 RepID=UPI0024B15652|nr:hypothetical protein [Streptomyces sp. BPTC-684]WHM40914.1 hypothetical protein QIY60_31250 [Streptomyces sp. BPTC-684]
MPEDGKQLVLSARAERITAADPYFRGIDADLGLPHWIAVRPLASTSSGGPHLADLAGGRGWLIFTFTRCHAAPRSPSPTPSGLDSGDSSPSASAERPPEPGKMGLRPSG